MSIAETFKTTYAGLIADAIRERLQTGELVPGQWIRQEDLAGDLGVSKIPIREALQTLAAEGLIQLHPHRGAQVTTLTIEALDELEMLRELLESQALALAAERRSDADMAVAESAYGQMESALERGSRTTFVAANQRFHAALYNSARCPRLASMIGILWNSWSPYRGLFYTSNPKHVQIQQSQHRDMLRALTSRDGSRLARLQHDHRAPVVAFIRDHLGHPVARDEINGRATSRERAPRPADPNGRKSLTRR